MYGILGNLQQFLQGGQGGPSDMMYRGMGAERPGVYGNPGQFNPMPPAPRPDLPAYGRGNELPGMGQPPGGGVSGFTPGMQGIGTGVGAPNSGAPNMAFGGGSIGGYASGPGGMSRPMAPPMPERPGVYGNPGQFQPMPRQRIAPPMGGRAPMRGM